MHIFKMRMLILLRNKIVLFWTLIFPIALATFFNFAFANILKNEEFLTIPVGIVENDYLDEQLVDLMQTIKYGSTKKMYEVKIMNIDDAIIDLENQVIVGIIEFDDVTNIMLKLKNGGIEATILKSFLDEYVQTGEAINSLSLISDNDINIIMADLFNNQNYLSDIESNRNPALVILIYFFSLIGMALIQGGFWGTLAMSDLQANLSARGMRVAVSGKNKFSLLFIHLFASFLIHIAEIFIFLLYLIFILKINLSVDIGALALTCVIGSLTGITFGAFIAISLKKASEGTKVLITTLAGVLGGFLAGMMNPGVKYFIHTKLRFLEFINPVGVINDALYSLQYFQSRDRFYLNISILFAMTVIFSCFTYMQFRRDSYESI